MIVVERLDVLMQRLVPRVSLRTIDVAKDGVRPVVTDGFARRGDGW